MRYPFRSLTSILGCAALTACFVAVAGPLCAQQPLAEPPTSIVFMPRFDFAMSAAALSNEDQRFSWDTHWAGDFDLLDYVVGRATFLADYQALLGNEFRPFDPYQSNYTLEAAGSIRIKSAEIAAVLNHVSRHLGDRPKRIAVAWNSLGVRLMRRFNPRSNTIDVRADIRRVIEHAYVDYTWIGELDVTVRHEMTKRLGVYGRGVGNLYPVNKTIAARDNQAGGKFEAGVRINGAVGAIELFGGWQRLVDADPLDRLPREWGYAGFRLLGR